MSYVFGSSAADRAFGIELIALLVIGWLIVCLVALGAKKRTRRNLAKAGAAVREADSLNGYERQIGRRNLSRW